MSLDARTQNAFTQLTEVSQRLAKVRRPGWGDEVSHLEVGFTDDGLRVHWRLNEDALFQPSESEDIFSAVFRILGSSDIAPFLAALTLEGQQIACNGTIDWEIGPIAYANERFSKLKVFRVKSFEYCGAPCYAGTLRGMGWQDTTVATRLLDRMPVLVDLAIPEPPRDDGFFQGSSHPLRNLAVCDTDYHSFILRFAACKRFPHLEQVCFRESVRTDVNPRLAASQYLRWFESDAFPSLRIVQLAQVDLSPGSIRRLHDSQVGRQLSRLEVIPVESWCDRPILHAPDEDGDGPRTDGNEDRTTTTGGS